MAQSLPPLNQPQLEQIARIVGDTDDGLTGPEITVLLATLAFPDDGANQTKWKRLYNSLVVLHNKHGVGNHAIQLVNAVMSPARYISTPDKFQRRQSALNAVLAFAGYYVRDDGKVGRTTPVSTLNEALARANKMGEQLRKRNVHDRVLDFCKAELVQSNYFHAVFEAMKSIKTRINELSGEDGDGAPLVDAAFGMAGGPIIAINKLQNQTDEGEQKGFAHLLKGLFGMIRNPLAHRAKIEWQMPEEDALDILTTISFVHRKLDQAIIRTK